MAINQATNLLIKGVKKPRVRNVLLGIYVLIVIAFSATVRASSEFSASINSPSSSHLRTFVGELSLTEKGKVLLMVSDRQIYELRGHLDLVNHAGQFVQVVGYEYKHRVGPVYSTQSLTPPLQSDDDDLAVAPVVFVSSFSVVSE